MSWAGSHVVVNQASPRDHRRLVPGGLTLVEVSERVTTYCMMGTSGIMCTSVNPGQKY